MNFKLFGEIEETTGFTYYIWEKGMKFPEKKTFTKINPDQARLISIVQVNKLYTFNYNDVVEVLQ